MADFHRAVYRDMCVIWRRASCMCGSGSGRVLMPRGICNGCLLADMLAITIRTQRIRTLLELRLRTSARPVAPRLFITCTHSNIMGTDVAAMDEFLDIPVFRSSELLLEESDVRCDLVQILQAGALLLGTGGPKRSDYAL